MPLPTIKVLKDYNEKEGHGLLFPESFTWYNLDGENESYVIDLDDKVRLHAGDYAIAGFEHIALVETKRSLKELRDNLFSCDKHRANHAFGKLAQATKYPYLLLDFPLSEFSRTLIYGDQTASQVLDVFYRKMARMGIRLLWYPSPVSVHGRKLVGEQVIRILWNHIKAEECGDNILEMRNVCKNPSNFLSLPTRKRQPSGTTRRKPTKKRSPTKCSRRGSGGTVANRTSAPASSDAPKSAPASLRSNIGSVWIERAIAQQEKQGPSGITS